MKITTPTGYTLEVAGPSDPSRAELAERERIAKGRIRGAVQRRQGELYQQAATVALARRYASNAVNLALEVVGKVVTAYRSQPIRTVAGATPEQDRQVAEVVERSGLPALMPALARLAWWCGPVLMMPWPAGDAVRWRWYRPSACTVLRRGDEVLAAAAVVREEGHLVEVHVADAAGLLRLLVAQNGSFEVLEEVATPRCYAVEVRTRPLDPEGDDTAFGAVLHDAAVEAGFVEADLAARRKAQSGKQLITQGRLFGVPEDSAKASAPIHQQVVDFSEGALEMGADEQAAVIDLNTPPTTFIEHLAHITTRCLAAYGLELAAPLNNAQTFELSAASIATERATQARELAAVEREAIGVVLEASEAWGYANGLPVGDVVVFFAEQHAVSDPLRREALYSAKAARGGTNPVEAYMLDHPGITASEAEEAVRANILRTTEITSELAARRAVSPDNEPRVLLESYAQITGRRGGLTRGGEA